MSTNNVEFMYHKRHYRCRNCAETFTRSAIVFSRTDNPLDPNSHNRQALHACPDGMRGVADVVAFEPVAKPVPEEISE